MLSRSQTPKKRSVDGLTRKPTVRDSSFFAELDKTKNKFSGFWAFVIIILLIIFVGLVAVAINLKRANISTGGSIDNAVDNTDLSFAGRLSSVSGVGITTVDFNNQEFLTASGAEAANFPLKDSQFALSKDQIILTGKIRDSWIPVAVKLKINAAVIAGKFTFILAPNDLNNIVVYGKNQNQIQQMLDDNINSVLSKRNMLAKSVSVSDNKIEFQVIK
ncbi:MAG: hypothetical protein WCP91_03620 [Candidatus Berkelbacteria bacterium]